MKGRPSVGIVPFFDSSGKDRPFVRGILSSIRGETLLLTPSRNLRSGRTFQAGVLRAFRIPVKGVGPSDMRVAYRRAAMRYHPDKNRNVGVRSRLFAEEAFKTISQKLEAL